MAKRVAPLITRTKALAVVVAMNAVARVAYAQDVESPPPAQPAPSPAESAPPPVEEATPSSAPTITPAAFGTRGVIATSAALALTIRNTELTESAAKSLLFAFAPSADWFFLDRVSFGVETGIAYGRGRYFSADGSLVAYAGTTFTIAPRIGIDIPLSERFSFYPRAAFGLEVHHRNQRVLDDGTPIAEDNPVERPDGTTNAGPYVSLYTPLLFHAKRHFFFELGPAFFHKLAKEEPAAELGGQRTSIGGRLGFGIWFGGTPSDEAAIDARKRVNIVERKFGDQATAAFDTDFRTTGFYRDYARAAGSSWDVSIGPGLDVFVANHISLGFGGSLRFEGAKQTSEGGVKSSMNDRTIAVTPRVGVDLPITSWLSWYPRLGMSVVLSNGESTNNNERTSYESTSVAFDGQLPLLLHFASHAFLGVGPFVVRDITDSTKVTRASRPPNEPQPPPRETENLRTSVGGSVLVGGWL